jgi:hypothetical protein
MKVRPHIHCDVVVPGLEERWVRMYLKTIETKVREYFGGRSTVARTS